MTPTYLRNSFVDRNLEIRLIIIDKQIVHKAEEVPDMKYIVLKLDSLWMLHLKALERYEIS